MSRSVAVRYPRVVSSITAGWPAARPATSRPKNGVVIVRAAIASRGSGAESCDRTMNTRPVSGPECAEAGTVIVKRTAGSRGVQAAAAQATRAHRRSRLEDLMIIAGPFGFIVIAAAEA